VRTFRSALLNRLYEFVIFYQSGMPSYGWQLNHNFGHHQHFMQQDADVPFRDEYYWLEPDGTVAPRWRYLLRTVALAYWYMIRNGRLRPDYVRKLAVVMLLHALVLAALLAYDPPGALICFVSVIIANMFVNAWFSYSHHAGLSLKDRHGASYSNLNRLENLITFNTGYHTAHHVRASVHWYELPSFHATIAARVPTHCYLSGALTREAAVAQLARTHAAERASNDSTAVEGATS
jgi:fatty acid desaturase